MHSRALVMVAVLWVSIDSAMATETNENVTCLLGDELASDARAASFCESLRDAVAEVSDRRYELRLLSLSSENLVLEVQDLSDPEQPVQMLQRRMLDFELTSENQAEFAGQVVRAAVRQGTIAALPTD